MDGESGAGAGLGEGTVVVDGREEAAALRAELKAAREELARERRGAAIDRELRRSGVVDSEVGRTLVEAELARAGQKGEETEETRVERTVRGLKERKPYLFHAGEAIGVSSGSASGMTRARAGGEARVLVGAPVAAPAWSVAEGGLESLRRSARESGDRRLLLRYLEARRAR